MPDDEDIRCMADHESSILAEIVASLHEQRASLADIEAMGDQEGISEIKEQLIEAIKELEEALAGMQDEKGREQEATGSSEEDDADYEEDNDLDDDEEEEDEEMEHVGLGLDVFHHVALALEAGVNSDTILFAEWEGSNRGIASKLLSKMGYVKGEGLGAAGRKGIIDPVECVLLPNRRGLGGAKIQTSKGVRKCKKQSRGGERSRNKKKAAARREEREAKRDAESSAEARDGPGASAGLFSFINHRLGDNSAAAAKIKEAERSLAKPATVDRFGSLASSAQTGGTKKEGKEAVDASRRHLMQHEDVISAKQAKVQHFQAMLRRNKGNQTLVGQIEETLRLAVDDLEASKAERTRIQKSIEGKESSSKFWGKF